MSLFWAVNETEAERSKKIILQTLAIGYHPQFDHNVNQNLEPKSVRECDLFDNNIKNQGGKKQIYCKNKIQEKKSLENTRLNHNKNRHVDVI
jgi:hypothetical protein